MTESADPQLFGVWGGKGTQFWCSATPYEDPRRWAGTREQAIAVADEMRRSFPDVDYVVVPFAKDREPEPKITERPTKAMIEALRWVDGNPGKNLYDLCRGRTRVWFDRETIRGLIERALIVPWIVDDRGVEVSRGQGITARGRTVLEAEAKLPVEYSRWEHPEPVHLGPLLGIPRDADGLECACGGFMRRVECTAIERKRHGCDREETRSPGHECCARAFVCRVCSKRVDGCADAPEMG